MDLRRLSFILLIYMYRTIFSIVRYRRLPVLFGLVLVSYLIIFLSVHEIIILRNQTSTFSIDSSQQQNKPTIKKEEKHQERIKTSSKKSAIPNKFLDTTTLKKDSISVNERRLRYSFVDLDHLEVDLDYLDEEFEPSVEQDIDLPSPGSHIFSRILNVKGDISIVIFNRIPQCYEFTMNTLLTNISYMHSYKYVQSEMFTPFSYNQSSLLSIARSLNTDQYDRLIYERHIYFFDYYQLQFPRHPIWINLVRDPIYRVAAEYNRSREVCQKTNRCFVQNDTINETLDECVLKRNPQDCISPINGVSRMLPFFCGLTHPYECQEETTWTLDKAKQNIEYFYTVVGFAEEFYKFLYVLEKLLPQYFKLARLLFMNQHDPKILADERDINVQLPNNVTINILRPLLKYEYDIYDYIKERLYNQYRILVELDN